MQIGRKRTGNPSMTMWIFLIIFIVIVFVSFCIDGLYNGWLWNSPLEVILSIKTFFQIQIGHIFDTEAWRHRTEIIAGMSYYGSVMARIKISALTFGCGVLIAVSGSIFQSVFRNPMAAPTMLGVSTGVNAGLVVLVVQNGAFAYNMMREKYIYCYIGAFLMLAIIMILGKISSGRRQMSVYDLILVGVIGSTIVGAGISYYTIGMDNDIALVYQELSSAIRVDISGLAFAVFGIIFAITMIPMILMRFSFNVISLEQDDTKSLGINVNVMKFFTLVIGTIMIAAAMIHCGGAGMISLTAPFFARGLFGTEYRKQFTGCILIGGLMLLVCRDIVGLIPFGTNGLPLGTIVDFVVLPLYVWMMASRRRIWN